MFPTGHITATRDALIALEAAQVDGGVLLSRHVNCDWGEVEPGDALENDFSVKNGLRILSSYKLPTGRRVWIITAGDRANTTLILPEEFLSMRGPK